MSNSQTSESFRDLLLRYRARTSLTQRELADRVGVNRRSVQEWENGATYPSAERLETLIQVLVESHGLTAGQEMAEALAFWAAVEREAPRMRAALDQAWLARLLGVRAVLAAPPTDALTSPLRGHRACS